MTKVIVNKKLKQAADKKRIAGTRWEEDDDFILAVYQRYKDRKISAETLMRQFPGRTFHAIFSKVYSIRGSQRVVHEKYKDPNQISLPLGGELS